jgi:hypothetical protein
VTKEQFDLVLSAVGAAIEDGFHRFPEGCSATFQVAKDGVGFSVSRANAVKNNGGQLQIRTEKGESCFVSLADVFACVVDERQGRSARRAGFA